MDAPVLPERYEPGPLVGRGAMGSVWRARDRVLDVAVAIKVPNATFAGSSRGRAFFEREVRAAAAVIHPHLVPFHDWGRLTDGTPYLAMAWADGGSLENAPATWSEVRDRIAEVLTALAALHARGIVHRDLKPANVLLHQGRAWVADLGLAAATDELGRGPSRVEGTPRYMAPEQRDGRVREIGPATDLFAVGAILDELTRDRAVPEGLDDLLAALLHPDPLGRYDLAADALRALLALGEPAVVRPDGPLLAPLVTSSARSRSRSTLGDDSATYTLDDAPERIGVAEIPPWRRPAPPPWPASPPPEPRDPTHLRASLPLFALREPPLVGRDDLRQRLWDAASDVRRSGKPRVVVLAGEPGSGKTRIAESVARALEEGGHAEVVRVRHLPGGGPDHGFEGAARRLVRSWDESRGELEPRVARWLARDRGAEAAALAPAVCAWAGLRDPDEPAPDARLGTKLVLDHLRVRAWRGAAALVVDDAHHDAEILDVLAGLLLGAGLGDALPAVVYVTVDPQRLDEAGRAALARALEAGAHRIDVPRLDRAATRELIDALLPLSADVAEWLAQRCEGHPLLARQILLYWADQGVLADAGQLVFTAARGVSLDAVLPPDAAAAYLARLDALAPGDREATLRTLAALAAAGDALPDAVFAALAGSLGPTLLASGLIRRDEGWCRWEHGLVAAALRARLDDRIDREALLEEAAAAWQRFGAISGRPAHAEVGLLRLAAGRPSEALAPLLRACDEAMATLRTADHDRCADAALLAVEGAGSDVSGLDRARARYHAAAALVRRGSARDAVPLAMAARDGFGKAGALLDAAEALSTLGSAYEVLGERDRVDDCVREVQELAGQRRDPALAAAALRAEARLRLNRGLLEEAVPLLERLVADERRRRSPLDLVRALLDLAKARARQDRLTEAREHAVEALAVARAHGALVHQGPALHMLGQIATYAVELDDAQRFLQAALELAVVAHDETRVQILVGDLADLAHSRGDYVRARAGYLANLAYSTSRGLRKWEIVDRIHLLLVGLALREPDDALAHAERLAALAEEIAEDRARAWLPVTRISAAAIREDRLRLDALLAEWPPPWPLDQAMTRRLENTAREAERHGWMEEARTLGRVAHDSWAAFGRQDCVDRVRDLVS